MDISYVVVKKTYLSYFLKSSVYVVAYVFSCSQLTGPGLPTMLEQLSRVRADILSLQTKVYLTAEKI